MFETYKNFIFQLAEEKNFEDYEIFYMKGKEYSLYIEGGEDHSYQKGIAFRGSIGGRTGTAYTENFSPQAMLTLVESAYENMMILEPVYTQYYEPSVSYEMIDTKDIRLEAENTLKDLCDEFKRVIATYEDLQNSTGELKIMQTTYRVANRKGLNLSHRLNTIYAFLRLIVNREGIMQSTLAYDGGCSVECIEPERMIREGYEKCSGYFNKGSIPSGIYNVLIKNDIAALLLSSLSVFFNGRSAASGQGIYLGKIGEKVGNKCLSILEDPFDRHGVFVRPFDSLGSKAHRQFIIQEGVFKGFLNDAYSAKVLGEKIACNSHRFAYNLSNDIYPTNMRIEAGIHSFEELVKTLDTGVYITDISAYFPGHGVNPITGDFSIPATGFYIEKGQIKYALQGVAIAGNLYDFINNVSMVGNDRAYGVPTCFYKGAPKWYGCYSAPTILVEAVSISGE